MWRLVVKRTTPIAAIIAFQAYNNNNQKKAKRPLYFWGSNVYGLTSPDSSTQLAPIIKQPHQCFFWSDQGLSVTALCAGERHAACIDSNGDLWQWGEDIHSTKPLRRVQVKSLTGITCNDQIIFATNAKGAVIAIPVDPKEPVQHVESDEPMQSLSSGHDHLLGLSKSGKLYTAAINTCGNAYGQLGIGLIEATTRPAPKKESGGLKSVIFDWPREKAVTDGQRAPYEFEEQHERQMHDPISFQHVPIKEEIIDIAAGFHHSLALGSSGTVYAFGSNSNLQLGLGRNAPTTCSLPTPILTSLPHITQIAAAGNTSFFLSNQPDKSTLYAAGNGLYGQLGIGGYHHAVGEPALVPAVSNQFYFDEATNTKMPIAIRELWSGPNNAAVLMNTFHNYQRQRGDGGAVGYDLLAWGSNKHFQISSTSHANIPTPSTIHPPSPTSTTVDFTDLALSSQGPTTVNPEETLSFQGGQLQVLPDAIGNPAHRLFIAPEFSCIY